MTRTCTTRRLGWVLGLTSAAYFMVILDGLAVITALPRMQRDLHVGLSSLQPAPAWRRGELPAAA